MRSPKPVFIKPLEIKKAMTMSQTMGWINPLKDCSNVKVLVATTRTRPKKNAQEKTY